MIDRDGTLGALAVLSAAAAIILSATTISNCSVGEWPVTTTDEERSSTWEITCLSGESAFHDVAMAKPVWVDSYGSISYRSTRGHMVVIFGPENCISTPQPPKPVI